MGISAYEAGRLRKFQNSCARLIYNKKRDHVSDILKELHWLPCEARSVFKILCYVFKCLDNKAPSYLSELLVNKSSEDLTFHIPRTLTSFGDRAFSTAGPRLWNSLPTEIHFARSLETFKSKLKHYLFSSFKDYKEKLNVYKF